MSSEKTLLGDDCYVHHYKGHDNFTYIKIEYDTLSVLLTTTEALALLKWLQEQQSNIEELQRQEERQS